MPSTGLEFKMNFILNWILFWGALPCSVVARQGIPKKQAEIRACSRGSSRFVRNVRRFPPDYNMSVWIFDIYWLCCIVSSLSHWSNCQRKWRKRVCPKRRKIFTRLHFVFQKQTVLFKYMAVLVFPPNLAKLLDREDGSSMLFRNVGRYITDWIH
jgi:hypothetical protein